MASIDESFTVDNGVGEGYTVYFRRGNGCWWYDVTYNENGCRAYSRTHRIPKILYDQIKEKNNDK